MSCKFDYISKLVSTEGVPLPSIEITVDGKKKKAEDILAEKHVEMAQKLLSFSEFSLNSYSMTRPGSTSMQKLIFLPFGTDEFHKARRTAVVNYIEKLNYDEDNSYIKVRKTTINEKQYDFVYIDTRPMLNDLPVGQEFLYPKSNADDFVDDDSFYEVFLQSMFTP